MKGRVIALDEVNGRRVAALIEDGVVEDLLVDGPDDSFAPGAILRGICDRPLKGQGGMMLRLPDGQTGYLRGAKGMKPGQAVLVQVTSRGEPGKAVPVSDRVLFKSRFAIVTPGAPGLNISRAIRDDEERVRLHEIAVELMGEAAEGLIIRSAAEGASDDEVVGDIAEMLDLARAVIGDAGGREPELLVDGPDAHLLAWRDWPQPDQLDEEGFAAHDIEVARWLQPHVRLSGGAHAFVEPTRALVAVDVNTGADTSPAAGLKANIALARVLPRELRLRGLGGQIVVDFAPMPKKERRQLEQILRAAFRADGIETSLVGWTTLGNFELQRKRERLPLAEALEGAK
ncbi:ribonuclease E/G [Aliiroseovarius sp.]|uniref:ribonuclease E/G n=1 Tax=Aliiroseovarius sp. TaxID=1872442 RepID=UPI003BAC4A4B